MMFDICDDQLDSGIFSEGQSSFSDFSGMFFSEEASYQNPPVIHSEQYVVPQEPVQSAFLDPAVLMHNTAPNPSPSLSGVKASSSEGSLCESVSSSPSSSSPTSDGYVATGEMSHENNSFEGDDESDGDVSDGSSSDSEDEEDRFRKVPTKKRRVVEDKEQKKQQQQQGKTGARKSRQKKAAPAPTDPALPQGCPLPAILGGDMPAPLRRKRRKDMTEEEMKKKEEAGIPESEDSDSEERRLVRLPRETLLVMTSAQIGQYIRYLRATQTLSRGQMEELRRQKRLVKNRESAKSSRKKREALVSELQESIARLESNMDALRKDNERLANENIRLRNVLKMRDPALFDTLLRDPDAAAAGKLFDADAAARAQDSSSSSSHGRPTIRVASLVFFFIVFCFALFAQISVLQTRAGSPSDNPRVIPHNTWKRETIPEVSHRYSESKPWFTSPQPSDGRVLSKLDHDSIKRNSGNGMGTYKLPDIELSGSWRDLRSGLTIRRPSEWAPVNNLTYLYVAPDSCLSQMSAVSEQYNEGRNSKGLSFNIVVPLNAIRPSCQMSDNEKVSSDDDVFLDIRCNMEEISIIPESSMIRSNKKD